MRSCAPLILVVLQWGLATCFADDVSKNPDHRELPTAIELLRRASDLALAQDEDQAYWNMDTLLQIGDVQIRAGDFDGARRSIQASDYPYGRDMGLIRIAGALAGAGKRDESLKVLRDVAANHDCERAQNRDRTTLGWIEHLVATGDLNQAQQVVDQLDATVSKPTGFRQLAVAHSRAGDKSQAALNFNRALGAAIQLRGWDRVRALWETADAQLLVGEIDAAKLTISRLVDAADAVDAWAKVAALCEAGVLQAKLKDRPAADSFFRKAVYARQKVDAMAKASAMQRIAEAQARVGYIDDALKSAGMITADEGRREEALFAVAQAQLKAEDPDGAVCTALLIKHFVQYRDDSLHAVVDSLIAKRDLKKALTAAEQVHNPSRRASAILKTAAAHARSGDPKSAGLVASLIRLTPKSSFVPEAASLGFDYRRPDVWGVNYENRDSGTMLSLLVSIEQTAELAKWSMTLAQTIPLQPKPNYVVSFNDIRSDEVIRALARAHAATGDVREALDWAQLAGSDQKVASANDFRAVWRIKCRISALVGVAEGMLDRADKSAARR